MKIILIFLFLTKAVFVTAQDDIDRYIEEQLKEQKIVGLSIGIINKGKIVKSRGYGLANLEQNSPATENAVYKIASVSKQFVATAIMTLVQQNKLSLKDTVSKFFKDAPATWSNITVRHLLNHSSGLERESPAFRPNLIQPDSILIRASYKDPLIFPTGTKWQYCNLGYFVLADIVRQLSGMPFTQFMEKEIFRKYGLQKTQVTSVSSLVLGRADGYALKGKDSVINAEEYLALRPSGAFLSTVTDLMKWELMIQKGEVLTKSNWDLMWNDLVKTGANNPAVEYYGYGWFKTMYKEKEVVRHGGSLPGFRTEYLRFPAEGTAIIILTNSEQANPKKIAQGVADILLKLN